MSRLRWSLAGVALVIAAGVLAFVLVRRQAQSHQNLAPTISSISPPSPTPQPARAMGAIVIGSGKGFTVVREANPHEDFSYLHISFSGKGEMLLQDSASHATGFDDKAGALVSQIANSNYDEGDQIDDDDPADATSEPAPEPAAASGLADNDFRRLEVGQPGPGNYLLTVKTDARGAEGKYSLDISYTDRLLKMSLLTVKDVKAVPGTLQTYKLVIPPGGVGEITLDALPPDSAK